MADNIRWFVVHTYSGYENKVARNIRTVVENRKMQEQILDVNVPEETVTEIKNGKKAEAVQRKLFPGYVMVKVACVYKKISDDTSDGESHSSDSSDDYELAMDDEAWYVIRNTRGVTGFVGPGSKPKPLTDEEAAKFGLELEESSGEQTETDDDEGFIFGFGSAQMTIEVEYEVGDLVRILTGSFAGYNGTVANIDLKKETVTVLVPGMFGRETPVELGLDEVGLTEE